MMKNTNTPAIRFKGFTDAWEQCKLGEIGKITTGCTPSTSIPDYYSDDGIIWVTPTDICENITFKSARKLSDLGQQVGRVVPPNTILVTCIASIGKNTMLGNIGSFNQQINGLTPNENKGVPYFLLTESALWSAKMKSSAAAGTMQIVNRTEFSELKTWLPSLIEQQAIGNFFKYLDTLITLHQRKLDQLKTIKKSLLEKMFPKNGKSVPDIRFKGFTDAWEQRKLKQEATFLKGSGYSKADLADEGLPLILYGRLYTNYKSEIKDVDTFASQKKGTVFSSGNEVIIPASGETAEDIARASAVKVKDCMLGGDLNIVVPKSNIDSTFLAISISNGTASKKLASMAQGKSVVHIHNSDIEQLEILFPSLTEQVRIVGVFRHVDTLLTLHQRKLDLLKNIKKSLLQKMFV